MARRSETRWNLALLEADMDASGRTRSALAREAGVAVSTVGRVLNGRRRDPAGTLLKIAQVLGHPLERYVVGALSPEAVL